MAIWDEVKQATEGFEYLGRFIEAVFENQHALFFVTLAVFTLLVAQIFRALFARIPIFQGEGGRCNPYGNVIAWCISVLGVIFIGWKLRDSSFAHMMSTLAGPAGTFTMFMMAIGMGALVYSINRQTGGEDWAFGMGFMTFALTLGWLVGSVFNSWSGFSTIIVLFVIGIFMRMFR